MWISQIIQYSQSEEIVLNPANDYARNFVGHTSPNNRPSGLSENDDEPHPENPS